MAINLEQHGVKGKLEEIMKLRGFKDHQIDSYFRFYNCDFYKKDFQTREKIDRIIKDVGEKLEKNTSLVLEFKKFGIDVYKSPERSREVSFLNECGQVFHKLYDQIQNSMADKEIFISYLLCLQQLVGKRNLPEFLLIIL